MKVICMPLAENIPEPHCNWELVNCPVCGCWCYLTDTAKNLLELFPKRYTAYCTRCALVAGMVGKRNELQEARGRLCGADADS